MIRWIKKGILRLAGREVGPGGEFPESALPPERIAEFISRGWAERVEAETLPAATPADPPLVVRVAAPRKPEIKPVPPPLAEPAQTSKIEDPNERQKIEKPRRRGRPRKARG